MATPLVIDDDVREQIRDLITLAEQHPVDMRFLTLELKTRAGKTRHMKQMTRQSIIIPMGFMVTYSIEHNHPCGNCRHMSMSVERKGRLPNEHAIWMVAQELGFQGSLHVCSLWMEDLLGHGKAINVVQPLKCQEAQ